MLSIFMPLGSATTQAATAVRTRAAGFTIPLVVPSPEGATFNGSLRIQRFAVEGGRVVASGLVTATVVDQAGSVTAVVRTVSLPVTRGVAGPSEPGGTPPPAEPSEPDGETDVPAEEQPVDEPAPAPPTSGCPNVEASIGPLELDLPGLSLRLDRIVLDLGALPGSSSEMLARFCELASAGTAASPEDTRNLLNRLLRTLS
jgi:hypothetical protein